MGRAVDAVAAAAAAAAEDAAVVDALGGGGVDVAVVLEVGVDEEEEADEAEGEALACLVRERQDAAEVQSRHLDMPWRRWLRYSSNDKKKYMQYVEV